MQQLIDLDRRDYLKTLGAVGATAMVAGCQGQTNETIVPGTNSGFPPFESEEDGELVGFDIDLAEEVIERAGYTVGEWTDIAFESLIPSLNDGDIDLIAAGMTINSTRQEQIDFSEPYWEANQAVLVREGSDYQPEQVADLADRRIGAQSGTTGLSQIQDLIDDGIVDENDLRQYDNYTHAVEDLENENVDAIVIDVPVAQNFESDRDVVTAFVIETNEEFGLGMREDDKRLQDINDALAEIKEDGTYDDLVAKWFE